jgi:hypothetical protein
MRSFSGPKTCAVLATGDQTFFWQNAGRICEFRRAAHRKREQLMHLKRSIIDIATFDHKHTRSVIGPRADLVAQSADHILNALAHGQSPLVFNRTPIFYVQSLIEALLQAPGFSTIDYRR